MKVRLCGQPSGIVLVATMMTIIIIGIILAGYITLVVQVNRSVARSPSWNETIPVVESGIEEALTQLYCAGMNSSLLSSHGWTLHADGLYHKKRAQPATP